MAGKLVLPTPQITTGLWYTVNDPTATNQVGGIYQTFDSGGRPLLIQYVQMNATVLASAVAGTAVYYKTATHTTVTNTITEAESYKASSNSDTYSAAGVLGNASVTNTYYIWILKCGYFATLYSTDSIVAGDQLVLSNAANTPATASTWVQVSGGTAPTPTGWTQTLFAVATGSASSNLFPGWVYSQDI